VNSAELVRPISIERIDPWPVIVAGFGVGLLLLRPVPLTSESALPVLLAVYPAIAAASLATPLKNEGRTAVLDARVVLLLGVAVVVASPLFSGPPLPLRTDLWSIPFVVVAAVAEEVLFRRLLYGRLLAYGAVIAIVGSAAAFALVHLPAYGTSALPLDLGAGILLSWQRWASGTWTVPAGTHIAANLLAVLR
jgi:membrane protease YdiL (CAAX protease family)